MIFILGSCLYEIMFRNGQPEWSGPGGSSLNAAVSLARSGNPVQLMVELGSDKLSGLIADFLGQNDISYDPLLHYEGSTRLSLAFLNESGDADYSFYSGLPEKAPILNIPAFYRGDVALLGSMFSLAERNALNVNRFIQAASAAGATLVYDPNYRHTNIDPHSTLSIREIMREVSMVRASDEDMRSIAGAETAEAAWQFVKSTGCPVLVYTSKDKEVVVFTPDFQKSYPVKPVEVVSTIGAGDAFNAGLLSYIHQNGKIEQNIEFWDKAIERALIFAAEVCGSHENYIRRPL